MTTETTRIFLSYTKADVDRADEIYDWLTQKGFAIWKDDKSIVPGQNWDHEIKKALDKAQIVIALISNNSVTKRGYVQRELKSALDKLSEKLIDDIYIIPIILDDDAIIPDIVAAIHYVKYSDPRFREKVVEAINTQLERLGEERKEIGDRQDIQWTTSTLREEWDGIPGYEFECEFLKFSSSRFPNVAQIGEYIRGEFLKELFLIRGHKLDQSVENHNYAQDRWARTNTFDANCSGISIVGKVLTIPYSIHYYWAGAAHPNHGFITYSFVLEPLVLIQSFFNIFLNEDEAFSTIQRLVRTELKGRTNEEGEKLHEDSWVDSGTEGRDDFKAFVFREDHVEFLFAPYQVDSYAGGSHEVQVNYREFAKGIKREYLEALGIVHYTWDVIH